MHQLTTAQKAAADALEWQKRTILIGEVGAGKTVVLSDYVQHTRFAPTVIVTPSYAGSGPHHWIEEIHRWDDLKSSVRSFLVMHGSKQRRLDARSDYFQYVAAGGAPVLVCTYSGMRDDLEDMLLLPFTDLIIDEAHRCADRRSAQTKAAMKLAKQAERLIFSSGTPVLNRAADLWSLFRMIDPKQYRSYWAWVDEHCIVEERYLNRAKGVTAKFPTKIVGEIKPDHVDAVKAELDAVSIRFATEHVVDEPRITVLPVELSPRERRLYNELNKHYFVEHGDEEVVATNEAAKMTKLRQISSDWSGVVDEAEPGSKVKAVIDLVQKGKLRDDKVVILCAFKATVARLVEKLGVTSTDYTGDLSDEDRFHTLREFRENPELRVLVGTLASLGEGIDGLQYVCNDLVMLDREWNHARNDQVIGRLYRHGQTKRVNVWHVVAKDSSDDRVARALATKGDLLKALGL